MTVDIPALLQLAKEARAKTLQNPFTEGQSAHHIYLGARTDVPAICDAVEADKLRERLKAATEALLHSEACCPPECLGTCVACLAWEAWRRVSAPSEGDGDAD